MNKDIFAGKWKQLQGKVREWWGDLTEDDVAQINGKWESLVGVLQERYGYSRQRAEEEIDRFTREYEAEYGEAHPTH